jgi:hypothetical protein
MPMSPSAFNAAYPYGVRLWDEAAGNTLEVRLCKSLDEAIYSENLFRDHSA